MRYIVLSLLLLSVLCLQGQTVKSYEKAGTFDPRAERENWDPALMSLEAPAPGGESYRSHLMELKATIGAPKKSVQAKRSSYWVPKPTVHKSFAGNTFNGSIPNDNDVAISNGGKLVSVKNTDINFYDIPGDSLDDNITLQSFSTSLGLSHSKYDPKVRYDPIEDKFIMVYLSGFNDSTSNIIVAFSTTNDPNDPWNIYALPGDPLNNGTWSDYPIIALTSGELFITINSLYNDSSWQAGFVETLVWQIDKSDGYTGAPLTSLTHNNIDFGGNPIRNLCLVQGGSGLTGPEMYLVSNRNFDMENDTIFLVKISGAITSSPSVTVDFVVSSQKYGLAPSGRQFGSHSFDTNDSRILGAYIENGRIHFVGNSIDHSLNTVGVYHGLIEDVSTSPTCKGWIISHPDLDFGYPNISYTGNGLDDDQCIISFNHTGDTTNAGLSASAYYKGHHSEVRSIHTGSTYVNIQGGFGERWGDYSGTQRKYDEPGKVWVAGYSSRIAGTAPFTRRENATWIAELSLDASMVTDMVERDQPIKDVKLGPNPTRDFVSLDFNMEKKELLSFDLFSLDGKLVKHLLENTAKKGNNRFTFNTEPLAPGTYILRISLEGTTIISKKIIKS